MNGDFLNNLYMLGGLFVALTTVIGLFATFLWRAIQQIAGDVRRLDKRLSREIRRTNREVRRTNREVRRTNREARKTRKAMWLLRVDMEVVKDRLNIGTVSRSVDSAPVVSDPEEASPALADPGSVGSAPVADIAEADVGSEAVADRPGPAGVVSPGLSAAPLAAEK